MTFAPTYEELLTRNEKYENAIRDVIADLEHIEAVLRDMHRLPLSTIIQDLSDLADWDVTIARSKLEKALQ
mgnify:FL=1